MSDQKGRREALSASIETYLDLIGEAEAVIAGKPYTKEEWDLSTILDVLAPPPLDLDSIDGASASWRRWSPPAANVVSVRGEP